MCDTLVTLTPDGPIFGKNSDRDPNESQRITWHAAADHDPGELVRCTWSTIPQAAHTHPVMLSRPWWMWGAEMGTNEHGVTIGNEAVFTRGGAGRAAEAPLLGMDLVRLGLERAPTAEQAVSVMVELLEAHGQGGSCSHEHPKFTYDSSFLVCDRDEAWVLETAGRSWASLKVAGRARSISNALTIPGFAAAHADPVRGTVARATRRQRVTQTCATGVRDVAAMAEALRRHEGVDPVFNVASGALGAPCAHAGGLLTATQTTGSWVADLRTGGSGVWATGASAPCTAVFLPVAVAEPCAELSVEAQNRFDSGSYWWRHELLHRASLRHMGAARLAYAGSQHTLEAAWFDDRPGTSEAVGVVDRAQDEWLDAIVGLGDRRPAWLRGLWGRWDRAAGVAEMETPST